ncbi:hypothetical protein VNO77_21563 [Canavalia gladiata]|uniref:Uncharacterized protein n=1 Tax=Canavalia gladiata TaxID=3824 RepID=A0AAN9QM87_CANGL
MSLLRSERCAERGNDRVTWSSTEICVPSPVSSSSSGVFLIGLTVKRRRRYALRDRDTVSVRCDDNGMHAKLEKRRRGVLVKSRSMMMVRG